MLSWVTSLPAMEDLVNFCAQRNLHPEHIVSHRFRLEQAHGKAYRCLTAAAWDPGANRPAPTALLTACADAYRLAQQGDCGKVVIEPSQSV